MKGASLICCNLPTGFASFNSLQPTATACAAGCVANTSCAAYTWHDSTVKGYQHFCYFVDATAPWSHVRADPGHFSAICRHTTEQPPPPPTPPPLQPAAKLWPDSYAPRGYLDPAAQSSQRDRGWRGGVPALTAAAAGSTLYVDQVHGIDSSSGTTPGTALRTLAAAVAKVPSLPAPRSILLSGGRHRLNESLRLTTEHHDTTIAPIDSDDDDDAIISGGVALDGLRWSEDDRLASSAAVGEPSGRQSDRH